MNFFKFFFQHRRILIFGFVLKLFSGFGQTFIIALYLPFLLSEFNLSNTEFGGLYSLATILSSISLSYFGKLIDYSSLKVYTVTSVILFLLGNLLLGISLNLYFVLFGLWGIRLAGQGLMSHISSITISKYFDEGRGKALSVVSIGYSLSEGIFPIFVSSTIIVIGWRNSFYINALLIGLVLLPIVILLLTFKSKESFHKRINKSESTSRAFLFKDFRFYVVALNTIIMPFLLTGFFFYQLNLAEEKNWSVEWMGFSFIGFASGRLIFSLLSGTWIDRWSAIKIFPYYLLPFVIGLSSLLVGNFKILTIIYLFASGISVGINTNIIPAVLAELYGTLQLGGIRSIFSMLSVISTALSPLIFGFSLDFGFAFTDLVVVSIGLIVVTIILTKVTLR